MHDDSPTTGAARPSAARRILGFLSARADAVMLAAGALHQVLFRVMTFEPGYDHAVHVSITMSLLRGAGLGTVNASLDDLSVARTNPMNHWPAGFPTLMAPFVKIFGPYGGMVATEILGIGLFYGAVWQLLRRATPALHPAGRFLLALIFGFVAPSYLETFTNLWALSFFLWAVHWLAPRPDGRSASPAACAAAGFLLAGTIALRYAYLPQSVVPIALMTLWDWRTPEGRRRLGAMFAGWGVMMAVFLWWKLDYAAHGRLKPFEEPERLMWENLKRFHPFGADSIFGRRLTDYFRYSSYNHRASVREVDFQVRHLFSLVMIITGLWGAWRFARSAQTEAERLSWSRLLAMGFATSAALVTFLVVLAVRNRPDPALNGWVYVESDRYFNAILPFLAFGVVAALVRNDGAFPSRICRIVAAVSVTAAIALWTAMLPSEWRAMRRAELGGPLERFFYDRGQLVGLLNAQRSDDKPNVFIEFAKNDNGAGYRRSMANFAGWNVAHVGKVKRLKTSQPVNVVAMAGENNNDQLFAAFDQFCRENGELWRTTEMDFQLCRVTLLPPPKAEPAR